MRLTERGMLAVLMVFGVLAATTLVLVVSAFLSVSNAPAAGAPQPVSTQPAITQPAITQPAITQPAITQAVSSQVGASH